MAFKTKRWTLANILPMSFVVWIIGTLWYVYFQMHLLDLLQFSMESGDHDLDMLRRGRLQAVVSQTLTVLLIICLLRAIFTDPGSVPESRAWKKYPMSTLSGDSGDVVIQHEAKADGQRRFCKWCDMFKPDRTHHCRVCRFCTLRMDHHCPWIANCVGFHNHKYFFLLVFYALLNVVFIIATMSESMNRAIYEECTPKKRFTIIFAMTLASIMGILLMMFLAFHISLMLKATTTIEFCEKQANESSVSYDAGTLGNIQAVLGPNMLLWLLPLSPPEGDGMTFHVKGQVACTDGDDLAAAVAGHPRLLGLLAQIRKRAKARQDAGAAAADTSALEIDELAAAVADDPHMSDALAEIRKRAKTRRDGGAAAAGTSDPEVTSAAAARA